MLKVARVHFYVKLVLLLAVACVLAVACIVPAAPAPQPPATAGAQPTTTAAAEPLKGKVTFYAESYYNPDAAPEAAREMEALVAEYQARYPERSIELVPFGAAGSNFEVWFNTRLQAGEAPNICWRLFYDRNREGSKVWVPLNDYLSQPNPYVPEGQPGSEKWIDLFPDFVMAQTRAGDGNWYQISMDWVETALFYNKEIFDQVGVDPKNWKDWTAFLADSEKLRAAGYEPLGIYMVPEWSTYEWMDDVLISATWADQAPGWYLPQYSSESLPWRQVTTEELAKAIKEGKFSTADPRFDLFLRLMKETADKTFLKGFAGLKSDTEVARLFVEGKVAMAWLGTWNAPVLEEAKFEYGTTYLPPVSKAESPYETHDTSYRVGGPSSAGEYGITQETAKTPGLVDVAVDWLMYWSAPQNFQRVYDQYPVFVPMVKGMRSNPVNEQFTYVASLPERAITDPNGRLSVKYGTEHIRIMQRYLLGEITAEQAKADLQKAMDQSVAELCQEQKWDWCE